MRDLLLMDIAMNLTRIGNWAADDFVGKKKRILQFLQQTDTYLKKVNLDSYPPTLQQTIRKLLSAYPRLAKDAEKVPRDSLAWAEMMLTWGNILTHRAKLAAR